MIKQLFVVDFLLDEFVNEQDYWPFTGHRCQ